MDIIDTLDNIIQEKVITLNKQPHKCLNWKTPCEVVLYLI